MKSQHLDTSNCSYDANGNIKKRTSFSGIIKRTSSLLGKKLSNSDQEHSDGRASGNSSGNNNSSSRFRKRNNLNQDHPNRHYHTRRPVSSYTPGVSGHDIYNNHISRDERSERLSISYMENDSRLGSDEQIDSYSNLYLSSHSNSNNSDGDANTNNLVNGGC